MNEKIKEMIRMAAEDGVITETEKALIIKKAKALGEDEDMVELAIEGELGQLKKEAKKKVSRGEKCPNCGAIIPAGAAVCPSCGFELRVREANSTALKLQEDLKRIDNETKGAKSRFTKKQTLITSTVIPNTKDDLLELMAFSSSKADTSSGEDVYSADSESYGYAYYTLFNNCIMLARTSFSNDPDFQQYFKKYEDLVKQKKAGERKRSRSGLLLLLLLLALIAAPFYFMNRAEAIENVEKYVKEKNFDAAKAAAQRLPKNKRTKLLDDIVVQQIQSYVSEGNVSSAKFLAGSIVDQEKRAQVLNSLESLSEAPAMQTELDEQAQ